MKADTLPVSPNAVISLHDLSSLPHLQGLMAIPKIDQDKVSLLIGLYCPNAHRILEMRDVIKVALCLLPDGLALNYVI